MDKLMNKMDDMELDMVAGGKMKCTAPDNRPDDSYFNDFCKSVKNGVNKVKDFFDFFKPKWTQPGKLKNNIIA